jgi:hypothetical protein
VNEFTLHRLGEVKRVYQLLRETYERRYYPDTVVVSKFDELELELSLLKRAIEKEK